MQKQDYYEIESYIKLQTHEKMKTLRHTGTETRQQDILEISKKMKIY